MNRNPNYEIVEDAEDVLCIGDLGPWDKHLTITNGAEIVVKQLASRLNGRRLEYYDSEGKRDQLLVSHGEFNGFAPAGIKYETSN